MWDGEGTPDTDGQATPRLPTQSDRPEPSPRKRRNEEAEPALVVRDAPAALVCDYCSSRGKVHRKHAAPARTCPSYPAGFRASLRGGLVGSRCLRLESCPIVWKRHGKSKKQNSDANKHDPGTPTTPPTPGLETVRSGRAPALPPAKRAQSLSARTSEPTMAPLLDADDVQFMPTPCSELWPFPVIVPPEAVGFCAPSKAHAALFAAFATPEASSDWLPDPMAGAASGGLQIEVGVEC